MNRDILNQIMVNQKDIYRLSVTFAFKENSENMKREHFQPKCSQQLLYKISIVLKLTLVPISVYLYPVSHGLSACSGLYTPMNL